MEQDQRLTPLPKSLEVRNAPSEYPAGYSSYYDDDTGEGRRTVQQYLNIIYKRLPIILALTLLATAAAAFYMYRQPSLYQATTRMIIEPRKPKVQSKDTININFGDDINYYNTQLQLLQSTDLMKEVVIRLGLYRDPSLQTGGDKGLIASLRSMFSSDKASQSDPNALPVIGDVPAEGDAAQTVQLTPEEKLRVESYATRLAGGLDVEQQERTNIVNVNVRSENPQLSAKVADKVADVFMQQDIEREMQGSKNAYNDLSKSIEELKKTISDQEADMMAYMREHVLPLADKGSELSASRLQGLSETWMKSMDGRRQIEARYNTAIQASSRGEGASIPDLNESKIYQDTVRLNTERKAKLQDRIADIDKQIKDAEAEKAELLVKYTPEYFKVKQVDERVGALQTTKEQTEKEVSAIIEKDQNKIEKDAIAGALTSLRSQLDAARRQESQAQAAYEQEAARANVQGQAETRLTTLKREIETNRNLLDTYTQRQKEQELAIESGRPDNIKIAANAVADPTPVSAAAWTEHLRRLPGLAIRGHRSGVPAGLSRRLGKILGRHRAAPRPADAGSYSALLRLREEASGWLPRMATAMESEPPPG